jgi:hypothetical protein
MRKVAIIDMGTNTFNLLVAVVNGDGTFQIINSSKQPVKLGEGGINQKIIAPAAYQRGLNAIAEHFRPFFCTELPRCMPLQLRPLEMQSMANNLSMIYLHSLA